MLVGRQLGLKGGSVGLRCLSVAAGEASEALGHVEASEGRLDRNRVSLHFLHSVLNILSSGRN